MILWNQTHPHPGQARIWNQRKAILSKKLRGVFAPCGPRWGKDVVTRETALWIGFSLLEQRGIATPSLIPPVMQWVAAPTFALTDKLFDEYEAQTRGFPNRRVKRSYPKRIELGGYHIEFVSTDKPEGLVAVGLDILHLSEAGGIKDAAWEEYLQQRLLSPGRLGAWIINGTPGTLPPTWYVRLWERAERDPEILFVNEPSWNNSFLSNEQLAEIEAHRTGATGMPEMRFRTTYGAELIPEAGGVFRQVSRRATGAPFEPDWGVYFYDPARSIDHNAVVGFGVRLPVLDKSRAVVSSKRLDPTQLTGNGASSNGKSSNGSNGSPNLSQCYADRWNDTEWGVTLARLAAIPGRGVLYVDTSVHEYKTPMTQPIQDALEGRFQVLPFRFNQQNKQHMTEGFAYLLERGLVELLDPAQCKDPDMRQASEALQRELTEWRARKLPSGNIRYEGIDGGHDDMAIACIAAAQLSREASGGRSAEKAFVSLGGAF